LNEIGICSSSSAHRRFQEWTAAGVFLTLWQHGLLACDTLQGIDWDWLVMDGTMTKAPFGEKGGQEPDRSGETRDQTEPAYRRRRTYRPRGGKSESARLHDGAGEYREHPCHAASTAPDAPQGLYLDKDYDVVRDLLAEFGFTAHIRSHPHVEGPALGGRARA
jgi:hypothetical protein